MFENKVAVVTGGASGIGKAIAKALASHGARVVIADLNLEHATPVAQAIEGLAVQCDVTKPEAIEALVSQTEAHFGPIDIFCSNAGLALGQEGHAASASDADWQLNWDIHVMAHVRAARAVLPKMIERGSGYLLQVSSAAGLLNQIEDAAYSATKHAAVSFAESLAITHRADGISVSVLCPQYVATPLLDMVDDTPAVGSLLSAETVASCVIEGMRKGQFLILPHEQVSEFVKLRASDHERWLKGMQGLRRKVMSELTTGDLKQMYKFI